MLAGALPNGSSAAAAEGVGQAKGGEHQNVGSPKAAALQEGATGNGKLQETGAIQVNACQSSCEQHVQFRCREGWQGGRQCRCHLHASGSLVLPEFYGWAAQHPRYGLPVLLGAS